MAHYILTEADKRKIQRLIDSHDRRGLTNGSDLTPTEELHDSSAIYIVRIPEGEEVQELTIDDSGTAPEYLPGQADLAIWQVTGIDGTAQLSEIGAEITVFNILTTAIKGPFALAKRDKFGRYILSLPANTGFIGKTTSTITARSGTTVGSGTFERYYLVGTTITATGETYTVYNFAASSIASGTYGAVMMDREGNLWIDSPECA